MFTGDHYTNTVSQFPALSKNIKLLHINPFKDETQTALFKDPVRTAQ